MNQTIVVEVCFVCSSSAGVQRAPAESTAAGHPRPVAAVCHAHHHPHRPGASGPRQHTPRPTSDRTAGTTGQSQMQSMRTKSAVLV